MAEPFSLEAPLPLCPCCRSRPMAVSGWQGRCEECLGGRQDVVQGVADDVDGASDQENLPAW